MIYMEYIGISILFTKFIDTWYRPVFFLVSGSGRGRCEFTTPASAAALRPWVAQVLDVHYVRIRGGLALRDAGHALSAIYQALRRDVPVLPEERCRSMVTSARRFLRCWRQANGKFTPKFHYLLHLCEQARSAGNPSFFHTYPDEAFHRRVKRVATRVHSTRFACRVLARLKRVRCGSAEKWGSCTCDVCACARARFFAHRQIFFCATAT